MVENCEVCDCLFFMDKPQKMSIVVGGDIFLNIRNSIMLWVVLYALCYKKTENILRKQIKFYVLPPVQGVWKIVKTHYNPKNENPHM